jgi:hypothetical protein
MADLCLRLRVFVASSSELKCERDIAERQVLALASEAIWQNLFIEPFLWEKHARPAPGRPQLTLNEALRPAEHVVVLFWKKLGGGTLEELNRALDQARRGETDNVSIYFKTPQGTKDIPPELVEFREAGWQKNLALTWNFGTPEQFGELFNQHLRSWLHGWYRIMPCCRYALEHSPPLTAPSQDDWLAAIRRNRSLPTVLPALDYLGRAAVEAYQDGPERAILRPLAKAELDSRAPDWRTACASPDVLGEGSSPPTDRTPPLLLTPEGNVHFCGYGWFYYFAAVGLAAAIRAGQWQSVARQAYRNEIHQYLAGYVRQENINLVPTLRRWLTNADGALTGQSVARDFSAYVLGMLGDHDSQEDLHETLQRDNSATVKRYCLTSLGKLRSRRYLSHLVDRFHTEADNRHRLLISQVICNIVGIRHFPL